MGIRSDLFSRTLFIGLVVGVHFIMRLFSATDMETVKIYAFAMSIYLILTVVGDLFTPTPITFDNIVHCHAARAALEFLFSQVFLWCPYFGSIGGYQVYCYITGAILWLVAIFRVIYLHTVLHLSQYSKPPALPNFKQINLNFPIRDEAGSCGVYSG